MTTTKRETDLISVIVDDHRAVEGVFTELESGTGDAQRRKDLVDHVIAELVRHSVAEEQHMYPAARKHLEGGDELADHEIEEHSEAEKVMKQLERLDPGDDGFESLLANLMTDIRHHIEDEEQDLLPKLRAACPPEELRDLGEKVLAAKEKAPTRPHPGAPDRPPVNLVLDRGAAFVDKIRDTLSGRHT
ncbi:hemerythrin domain-containing protein [Amycolatopsis sp. FDAARGOS 1241]|uniref:hemerythrin domain-containing protein n=1 Tax=Amycolatopsis sp. FDAARGOS 1241 TaxID=2778070 RepID=UPI001950FC99|nr:hemerythrin domain-containing protein [Amycolatopsis sp. FDAARGOS 1241]QRP49672.1 hemerythrin domain-containing protein [Amycolatopsis sp. FDAARGOS 1241]